MQVCRHKAGETFEERQDTSILIFHFSGAGNGSHCTQEGKMRGTSLKKERRKVLQFVLIRRERGTYKQSSVL